MLYKFFSFNLFMIFILLIGNTFSQEGGYSNKLIVSPGENIDLFISTAIDPFTLSIHKYEDGLTPIGTINSINGGIQPVPDSAYIKGCGWDKTYTLTIPNDWEPGAYRAMFPISENNRGITFFVSPEARGSYSNILLVLNDNTWQAYNYFGGKSLYGHNSTNNKGSYKVSFIRPHSSSMASPQFNKEEKTFIKWAFRNNIKLEFASQYDLFKDPNLLNNYDVVISAGHSEYWTRNERLHLQNFVSEGGKYILLSGNSCYWQVRYEDNGNTLVCYRDASLDPYTGIIDSLVTVNWFDPPVNFPEALFTGTSFKYGGYVNWADRLPASEGYGDYAVVNDHNWIFENTDLSNGDEYGYTSTIVGHEVDGNIYEWRDGVPIVTGEGSTPLNYRILSLSPAEQGNPNLINLHAVMGLYYTPQKGALFNAATIDWSDGLDSNAAVQSITKNVITKFLENRVPPEVILWNPAVVKRALINKEEFFINQRYFTIHPDETTSFNVLAEDPLNRQINYKWLMEGEEVGNNAILDLQADYGNNSKQLQLKCLVYNQEDTTELKWDILYNPYLRITSMPVSTVLEGKNYNYTVEVDKQFNETISYELLTAPAWLSINSSGLISGTAPKDTSVVKVVVKASSSSNLYCLQQYYLRVLNDPAGVESEIPLSFSLEQNYPNPFNPSTNIRFILSESSVVDIIASDLLGRQYSIINKKDYSAGNFNIEWNPDNLSSGIYFITLTAQSNVYNRVLNKTIKAVYLK